MIAFDPIERKHRLLEEAIEIVQPCDGTVSDASQQVDYVFARPVGSADEKACGVMLTLAVLCSARSVNMAQAGKDELTRMWTKVGQIRKKEAAKPKHSPLPAAPQLSTDVPAMQFKLVLREWCDTLLALHAYMATVLSKYAPVEWFARVCAAFETMGCAIDGPASVIRDVQP